MKKHIVTILLAAILATSCSKAPPQMLSFEVLVQSSPFTETSPPLQDVPNLIVIASLEEISPPIPEFEFSDTMVTQLNAVDYEQSFAVLILVGQMPTDGIVTDVSRMEEKVSIKVNDYIVGPGNYKLKGYSLPYQLISVEKEGSWNTDIEFILEEENGNILGRTKHHIP